MANETEYVLTFTRDGERFYYREWTGFGPETTTDLAVAKRYATIDAANRSEAHRHLLSAFDVAPVSEVA